MSLVPPTMDHLARLYFELGKAGARAVGAKKKWPHQPKDVESLFALAADLSRFDPRLLQILVEYGLRAWKNLNPQKLRENAAEMETPQCLGVVAAFILTAANHADEPSLFWNYVTAGWEPVPPQFYFCDLHSPGSALAERAAKESLQEFKQWGFLGRERVIADTKSKKGVGTWDPSSRLNILRRLLETKGRIQISDYLEALDHSISRQQALHDLKKLPAVRQGQGRGAGWKLP